MLTNDLVQHAIDSLPVEPLLTDTSFHSAAPGANKRCEYGPAQGLLKAEHDGVHGWLLEPTYCFLSGARW